LTVAYTYEINHVTTSELLPDKIKVVRLLPTTDDFKYSHSKVERLVYLNNLARKLRTDKQSPIIADVLEDSIVVLPQTEFELKSISTHGFPKKSLRPMDNPVQEIGIEREIYRRLMLRSIEIMLRSQKYMVREGRPGAYQYSLFSTAYVYSSGLSSEFFEVYRGFTFRVLLYSRERKMSVVIDPKFKFLPRLTLYDIYSNEKRKDFLIHWGGKAEGKAISFDSLDVVDVCPIRPEKCEVDARKSPYEADCKLYREKSGTSLSWSSGGCRLLRINSDLIMKDRPEILRAVKGCEQLTKFLDDKSAVAEVSFSKDQQRKTYYYPLERLRKTFEIDLIKDFVVVTSGSDNSVEEIQKNFARITKPLSDERCWWTELFVKDFKAITFGNNLLNFHPRLVQVAISRVRS